MAKPPGTIGSVEELREQVPAILKRLNTDQGLLLAAAANPVLALEELGYRIPAELHRELDRRVRFPTAERERLSALTARMHEIAKAAFDPDDPGELERLLFKQLHLPDLPPPAVRIRVTPDDVSQQAPRDAAYRQKAGEPQASAPTVGEPSAALHRLAVRYHAAAPSAEPDVLLALKGKHPIVEPLLEYRAIMARHAPFAPRELYDRIRKGTVGGPSFKLRARLHRVEQ